MLQYDNVSADVFIYISFAENMSKRKYQFICDQVFVIDFGYTQILLMKSKGYVHHAIKHFCTMLFVCVIRKYVQRVLRVIWM